MRVSIGQDFKRKGLMPALLALQRLNEKPIRLTVVGKRQGYFPPELMRHVTFVGEVDDTVPLYRDADFFVLPTRHDPCSLVVLEALAMGVPVISTKFNGACEIMTDGVHGFVLDDPNDVEAIAHAMRKLLDPDLRAQMSRLPRTATETFVRASSRHAHGDLRQSMSGRRRSDWPAIAIAAMFFAAVAPTLRWLEFSNGAEGLVVATAMEIRRTGNWLIPTLQGETRLAKPPLATWITAAAISRRTLSEVHSSDPAVREVAFRRLAWEVRAPALLAACVLLLATSAFARALGIETALAAATAAAVAGSMILMLRFCRHATTDIYLAMWVAIANALLVRGLFCGRAESAFPGAGAALGLALMTKGPVAVVVSIVPACIVAIMFRPRSGRPAWSAIVGGLVIMLAIALPWFTLVAAGEGHAWHVWFSEISRVDATDTKPDRWYSYLAIVPYAAPWISFFVAALVGAGFALARRERQPARARLSPLLCSWSSRCW